NTLSTYPKIIVKGGMWRSSTAAGLVAVPGSFTADAVVLDGGGIFPDITAGNQSIDGNVGITVTTNGGSILSGFNTPELSVNGSLSGVAGANLSVDFGTVRIERDLTDAVNSTTFAGKLTVNGSLGSNGQGQIIIDGKLNSLVTFGSSAVGGTSGGGLLKI